MSTINLRRLDETCNVEVHFSARCRGEEANDTCQCQHEFEQSRPDLMTKCHTFCSAHGKMRNVGSETQQRRRKTRQKQSQSCEIWTEVSSPQGECGESRTLSATNFTVSSEFTFGDNKLILSMFLDFAESDLTAYLTRNHHLTLFSFSIGEQSTHTSSRQVESDCLNAVFRWPPSSQRVSM